MRAFVILCVLSVVGPLLCEGRGWMDVKFIKYTNPGGLGANGHCCDGKWLVCQSNGCDHYFTLCAGPPGGAANVNSCPYGRVSVDRTKDADTINFGSLIGRYTKNPMRLTFTHALPDRFSLKVKVDDKDNHNDHDDVDFIKRDFSLSELKRNNKFTISGRTRLDVELRYGCNSTWYGDRCDVRCVVSGSVQSCRQDGTKVCKAGWTGKDCLNRVTCAPGFFTCNNGKCIKMASMCDGLNTCGDNSDELVCGEYECTPGTLKLNCGNGKCLRDSRVCDGVNDCTDGSDEGRCHTCTADQFTCDNGECISKTSRCNGHNDCGTNEDEKNCEAATCPGTHFRCGNQCLPPKWVCDGDKDCADGSDESEEKCEEKGKTCAENEMRCTSGSCIPLRWKCDGDKDCDDGSDETGCVSTTCSGFTCNDGSCLPADRKCDGRMDCPRGEDEDGCTRNTTCSDPSFCSHICRGLPDGKFNCSCRPGYQVDPKDQTNCIARGEGPRLLFSARKDIFSLDLRSGNASIVRRNLKSAIGLGVDVRRSILYWSDVTEGTINSVRFRNSSAKEQVLVQDLGTPDGLALDWIHRNLYWTDTESDNISVINVITKKRAVLISSGLDEPRAIAVDPRNGWMYWTDWGAARIERAGMDGSGREVLIKDGLQWPNGLTIDYGSNQLFWIDARLDVIGTSDLDGSNQRNLVDDPLLGHPFAIAAFEDYLYWSDWKQSKIFRTNKRTLASIDAITTHISNSPMDIKVFQVAAQPSARNRCAGNGGCSNLCLPSPTGGATCA